MLTTFTPINLDDDFSDHINLYDFHYNANNFKSNAFKPQNNFATPIGNEYKFLQSSVSSDVKIVNLDDSISTVASAAPPVLTPTSNTPISNHVVSTTSLSSVNPKNQPAKKRKRANETVNSDLSFVVLSREQLLEMSSIEFEDHVKNLENQRSLTSSEKEEIKRQRKLIKNREYAQTSRMKKRETLSTLKEQIGKITVKNEILKSQVVNLSQRVQYLEQENNHLRSLLSENRIHAQSLENQLLFVPQNPNQYPFDLLQYSLSPENNIPQNYSTIPLVQNFAHINPSFHPSAATFLPSPVGVGHSVSPGQAFNGTYTPSPVDSPESSSETHSPASHDDNIFNTLTSDSDDALSFDLELNSGYGTDQLLNNSWGFSDNYTRGICLLVILFSFGLFFSSIPENYTYTVSTARTLSSINTPKYTSEVEMDKMLYDSLCKNSINLNFNPHKNFGDFHTLCNSSSFAEFDENAQLILNDFSNFPQKIPKISMH